MSKETSNRHSVANEATTPMQASNSATASNHATNLVKQTQTSTSASDKTSGKITRLSLITKAYLAALLFTGVIVQIFAIIATAAFYFYFSPMRYPIWYAPVFGFLVSLLLWFICAVGCAPFANAQGANARSYGLLKLRLQQLNGRLGIEQLWKGDGKIKDEE